MPHPFSLFSFDKNSIVISIFLLNLLSSSKAFLLNHVLLIQFLTSLDFFTRMSSCPLTFLLIFFLFHLGFLWKSMPQPFSLFSFDKNSIVISIFLQNLRSSSKTFLLNHVLPIRFKDLEIYFFSWMSSSRSTYLFTYHFFLI